MEQYQLINTSSEPMDVDISSNSCSLPNESPKKSEQSTNYPDTEESVKSPEIWFLKKYHIQKKVNKRNYAPCKFLLTSIAIFMAILTYAILDVKCFAELDLLDIEIKLHSKVHDQSNAIENLLDGISSNEKNKLLILYGGTGVGKTFTVSILLDSVLNNSNVFHYTMPSFTTVFSLETMVGFSICKNSIIVIDDLRPHDLLSVKNSINEIIEKSRNLNKNVIVILVCNCDTFTKDFLEKCNDNFINILEKGFEDVIAYKKFVKYDSLTHSTLQKCIEDELGEITNFDVFINSFNVSLDGCKGVHKKIKLLKIHKV